MPSDGDAEASAGNVADGGSVENDEHNKDTAAQPIVSGNDDDHLVQQPVADMASEQHAEESAHQPRSNLDIMTAEVVSMFQQGYKQEALDATVAFALTARNELGAKSPIYINALATAAALIDQMGGQLEADALLMEAEDLQEQMELDAFEAEHEDDNDDELRWQNIRKLEENGEDANNADGADESGKTMKAELGDAVEKPFEPKPREGRGANDAAGDESGDGAVSSSDSFDRYAPSSVSDSGDDGDAEADMDDDSDRGDDEDENTEAEAEAITRLTWEVNSQLRQGRAEEAAQLLAEAESVLVGEDGGAGLSGVTRAALHTLWATVLDAVGEGEKAQCLYDEAIECLAEEVGAATSASSSDDDASEEGDPESEDAESVDEAVGAPPPPSDGGEAEDKVAEVVEDAKQIGADAEPAFFITDGLGDDANEAPPSRSPRPVEPVKVLAQAADDNKATVPATEREEGAVPDADDRTPTAPDLSEKAEAKDPDVEPCEPQNLEDSHAEAALAVAEENGGAPAKEETTSPSRPKGPKGVARPGARGRAPLAPPEPAKRTGGGFAATAVSRPAALKSKAKAKAKGKAKPKATENDVVTVDVEEKNVEPEGESAAPAVDVTHDSTEPEPAQCDDAGDAPAQVCNTPEDQLIAVTRAMTCADHFMGLMNFEKAADKLEEQLERLGSEDSPHKSSDLHIDVYMKYAGVLWWDCDPDSAIDAYTAADEILRERPESSAVRRRRADIRLQLAQVCRGCGDLESADSHLSDVVHVLSELSAEPSAEVDGTDGAGSLDEALREAQAALAQVCVQRKEFGRAEKLYMKAFRESDSKQGADAEHKAGEAT